LWEASFEALPSRNPKAVTGAKSWIQSAALMARDNFSVVPRSWLALKHFPSQPLDYRKLLL
jgi:hypothetical protein